MKAMIFAAGLGTRLRPLTNNKPKALVEVNGKPLLEHAILQLKSQGIHDIIVNVHHFGEQIISFLKKRRHFDINIQISKEENLLNTGGGLKKVLHFFEDGKPFVIWNADIVSNVDLNAMLKIHQQEKAISTLLTRDRDTSRYLIFDDQNVLIGWTNLKKKEIKLSTINSTIERNLQAFSGIHIVSPKIKKYMPDEAAFSIIDVYLDAAKKEKLISFKDNDCIWVDVGKPERIEEAEKVLMRF